MTPQASGRSATCSLTLAASGTAVFMSSHLLAGVEQVCDRVAVIVRGRVIEEGPPLRLGTIRRRVRVQVGPAHTGAAARLLASWPVRELDGQLLVEHDSGPRRELGPGDRRCHR
ncbi:MAG: hypothetical protein ABJB47_13865 [Actinomycetota bacterium]